jgi:hypothetical protein
MGDRTFEGHQWIVGKPRDGLAVIGEYSPVFKTDTGNFNRFLTSVGLLALAGAVVVPYFFFRNTSILEAPAAQLGRMSRIGRAAFEARQEGIVAMEPWVIGGAIALAVVGFALVLAGGVRLWLAQKSEDEETELRKARARLEVEEMSAAERDERATEKAAVEVEEEHSAALAGQAVDAAGDTASPETAKPHVAARAAPLDTRSRAEEIRRISQRIERAFRGQALDRYDFKWELRIGSAVGEVQVDGLFEANRPGAFDVLLDLRLAPSLDSLRRSARNSANQLIATLGRYEALTRRKGFGWLVLVLPTGESMTFSEWLEGSEALREALRPLGDVILLTEDQIDNLPSFFRERFEAP